MSSIVVIKVLSKYSLFLQYCNSLYLLNYLPVYMLNTEDVNNNNIVYVLSQ